MTLTFWDARAHRSHRGSDPSRCRAWYGRRVSCHPRRTLGRGLGSRGVKRASDRPDHRFFRSEWRPAGGRNRRAGRGRPDGAGLYPRGSVMPGGDGHALPAACRAALAAAGAGRVPIDAVAPGESADAVAELWQREAIDWVIAIERCGPAADGHLRNMRGMDIGAYAAPLERLFNAGPWRTIAIGDGGNEIGMGRVPRRLIARHVPLGASIGCTVPADHLVAAGVSHWGAYAMLAALGCFGRTGPRRWRPGLDPALDQAVIRGDGARTVRRWTGFRCAGKSRSTDWGWTNMRPCCGPSAS